MNAKLLDCTLRDGGYYNKWDFPKEVVKRYLEAVSRSGIKYVELGLRNFPKNSFLGMYAYTPETLLDTLELPDGIEYGVMVDAKTILTSALEVTDAVDMLFVQSNLSRLSFVRVAAHFSEVTDCEPITKRLKELGYIVGLNLMQSGGKPSSSLTEVSLMINSWSSVDVLYFADSLGNMDSQEVSRIVASLKKGWSGELGIHAHNNKGLALQNTLQAFREGVSWLDSTVTGMGRGAGNTETELLLTELEDKCDSFSARSLYVLVLNDFEPLKKHYGWGSSLLYFLAAKNNVHPTYIQNMLADNRYGPNEISVAIEYLSRCKAMNYDGKLFESAFLNQNSDEKHHPGEKIKSIGCDTVNLIGGGDVSEYVAGIRQFIKNSSFPTYSVNLNETLKDIINNYIISHNVKYFSDSQKYSDLSESFILPISHFSESEQSTLPENTINYSLEVLDGVFEVESQGCIVPINYTIFYAIAYLIAAGVSRINLIGFEGYDNDDPRTQKINGWLSKIQEVHKIEFVSMTPTLYSVKCDSIYAYC